MKISTALYDECYILAVRRYLVKYHSILVTDSKSSDWLLRYLNLSVR